MQVTACALALCMVVLAACGGSDDSDGQADPSPGSSNVSPAPTPATSGDTTSTTTGPAAAEGWQQVSFENGPSPRSSAVLVVAEDGTLYLHGGSVDGVALDELWRFDGGQWEQIQVAGEVPAARFEHVGVWDEARGRLVIALGQDTNSDVFDDVWAFDPISTTWTRLAEGGGPAARYGSCAVTDDQGRFVITHGFSTVQRFDDTWAFNLGSDAWTDISPAEGPRPTARCLHACARDPESGAMVLFGGRTNEVPYMGDTWSLGPAGWQEIAGAGPSARVRSRAGTLPDGIHLVGGTGPDSVATDAWQFADSTWTDGATGSPPARYSAAMAQGDGEVWVFGGTGGSEEDLGDLWRLG